MLPSNWIERQRHLLDFTILSLSRRAGKNAGLIAVYSLIVFVLASVMLFSHAIRREAAILLQNAPEIVVQRMTAGRHDLIGEEAAAKIRKLRGVQKVEGRLWGYFFDPAVSANYTIMAQAGDGIAPGQAVIGAGISRTRGAGPGDVLALRAGSGALFSFTVARVLPEGSEIATSDLILVGVQDFRAFFGIPDGLYTDLAASVRNPKEVRKAAEKIVQLLPDSRPILRDEILRTYESIFSWREGFMLLLLSGAMLAFVIFAWEKASGISAEERREIGILKAVGWETSDVMLIKMWEGILISLGAFLAGYFAAYIHVFYFSSALFEPILKGWAVLYPRFQLVPVIDGFQVATLFFLTIFPYTLAIVVPIWRTAIIDPDKVMR
jgi:ABC-type lipoprotein release transport system permease subunit